ncbi:LETM1-like protein [Artemisia annua]|uniref:LETM1-like protein n=1 Tax=Artemisia annua TaxID=35608 RepID=A0A2U1MZG6_ARTAN|nr:LETM1-like protein [Artemisia annua]
MTISQPHALTSSRSISLTKSLNPWISCRHSKTFFFHNKVAGVDYLLLHKLYSRKTSGISFCSILSYKSRRARGLLPFASADDSVTVNDSPEASISGDVEEMRSKLQNEEYNSALVQSLHDAARVYELAIKEQSSASKLPWFSTAWLGIDQSAWVKALSYQASVYSLLLAACEISSRGDRRDRDINVFVQRSLSRHYAPLETVIRDALSDKQPELYDWFWSEQLPSVVSSFVNYFEKDQRFAAATGVIRTGTPLSSGDASDRSLLLFALSCVAAITKLGPTKVACTQFYSVLPEITGRLMDMLVEFVPIRKAYSSIKEIGLGREFLVHFGPRAAACRVEGDQGTEEVLFWVSLVQKQLQRAIDRERIWSRLTTCESIEVLDKDLAIFGFFIALGRRTQSYLSANNFESVPKPIEGLIRYLIGGSVLYYPQLSSISSYQLYVEVVCEELDWLPFYPGDIDTQKGSHGHKSKQGPPNEEAIPVVLDVCSHWIQSFIKYSKWLENPSNVKAARFLSRGHNILQGSMEELGIPKKLMVESGTSNAFEITRSGTYAPLKRELDSFDKALESVDEALARLEELLQELHVSSSSSGKEHLKAACSDLEKMRKLKKEAEFLEASFRAKADSLRQGDDGASAVRNKRQSVKGKNRESSKIDTNVSSSKPDGLWNFLVPRSSAADLQSETAYRSDDTGVLESNEIQRFELLRNELIELERRVERSAKRSESEEDDIKIPEDSANYSNDAEGVQLVKVQEKEDIIGKSISKLKGTTTDVLQGTQLLAIDVGAATGLLRRAVIGDELTDKEKQALRRTLTDVASVIPIGILMLLPVTAVGHAAMLAAIQRYVPSLIPSTYGSERLDLLRQLEKVKEMETTDSNPTESAD